VYRRLLTFIAAMTILLMVLPPLFDTFDTWDKTPEFPMVGHNTETNLVVIGMDAGLCLGVAWMAVLLLDWLVSLLAPPLRELATAAPQPLSRGTEYLLLLFSPPWRLTSLRI